ncbi:copper chaperone CopZ [Marinitoga sp. 1197]|uniref:heavy-metal-associated domain-containing protein n=1 Tax=Marinitoga sp. 1197 TaxID=1428449 RepID=UPI0006580886|nr:heavy-metal-associated domain-containing protein [Marinitoga sp. 1197]KLO23210.1 copper chaperone CopZ [Marinitoga sp. 1197]
MKKVIIIEGMTCDHCVMHVKKELEKISGLKILKVEIGKAIIEGENLDDNLIKEAVDEAGYEVKEIKENDDEEHHMEHKHHQHEKHHHGHHMEHKDHKKHKGGCCH